MKRGTIPLHIKNGSAKNFKSAANASQNNEPVEMVDECENTDPNIFKILKKIELRSIKSCTYQKLEHKVRVLQEIRDAQIKLLKGIHATASKTSEVLMQKQHQNQLCNNNDDNNTNNTEVMKPLSPKIIVNKQQAISSGPSCSESVKYRIVTDDTGNNAENNEEPIEIQLAEDDGALNLNSSADSDRLEICLPLEENIDIKQECNTDSDTVETQKWLPLSPPPLSSEPKYEHLNKKRKSAIQEAKVHVPNPMPCKYELPTLNPLPQQSPKLLCLESSGSTLMSIRKKRYSSFNKKTCNLLHEKIGRMVEIGSYKTRIPAEIYDTINWSIASIATRNLLRATFSREILATHSMTGKPSPAFKNQNKPLKKKLDPGIVADIISAVTLKSKVSAKEVRNAITTTCADENRMMKAKIKKKSSVEEGNKENTIA